MISSEQVFFWHIDVDTGFYARTKDHLILLLSYEHSLSTCRKTSGSSPNWFPVLVRHFASLHLCVSFNLSVADGKFLRSVLSSECGARSHLSNGKDSICQDTWMPVENFPTDTDPGLPSVMNWYDRAISHCVSVTESSGTLIYTKDFHTENYG